MSAPSLEEAIRGALTSIHAAADRPTTDLHKATAELADAIEKVSGGRATVRLRVADTDEHATVYELILLVRDRQAERHLRYFRISRRGYPIQVVIRQGLIPHVPGGAAAQYTVEKDLDTPDKVSAEVRAMATDPDAPLLLYLAFVLRHPSPAAG